MAVPPRLPNPNPPRAGEGEMPPPHPHPHASAVATRFAIHWILDALAADESLDFCLIQELLGCWPEALAGAPEATRERVALRSLQELASRIPAGGGSDAAATAGVLRVDGARSCEEALSRLSREAEISGELKMDLLLPFSQDIQEIIRTKKVTLPETSFQLLKGVHPWILHRPCNPESGSYVPPQEDTTNAVALGTRFPERSPTVEGNMPVGSVLPSAGCDAPLQGSTSEPFSQQDTTMISQPDSRKVHPSALQHETGEKVNQDLEDVSASVRPVEKDHAHGDLTLQSANGANQGSNVETNLQPGTAAEDRMAFEEQNVEKAPLEVGANKGDQALHDDGSMMKPSEANFFSEQENENNRTDVQKNNCRTSIPGSSKDRDRESAKKTSNEEKSEDASPEISARCDSLEGLSQLKFCIKCGKDGELLTCSDCSLAAHSICFGPSVTFEGIDLFYCPVCACKKAQEDYLKKRKIYLEALKIAAAYVGTKEVSKQHDEQLNGVQPGDAKRDGHSNGSDIHQNEAYDLAHPDEEPHQQRKKQKINARGNGYPEEILTEKVPFQNSGPASMNRHSVLQNNSKARVEGSEKKQQAGDKETHTEAGNDNPSHETTASSQRACDPPLNQDNEADQEDNLIDQSAEEEPHQQRKKQKVNARGNGYPSEIFTEKVPFQDSGPASMNKHSVLQNNSKARVEDPEKKQQAGDKVAHTEAGNDNPSHETSASSQRACDPPLNQDNEADQEDNLIASNQSGGKRSSPPWRTMRHEKESESAVPSKSRKVTAKQGQRRKRGSVHPHKRYSNPVGPVGRRTKCAWTEAEVAMLRKVMPIFTPQDGAPFPWARMLEYGSHVFNRTRLPLDLRDKWRNLMKADAAQ